MISWTTCGRSDLRNEANNESHHSQTVLQGIDGRSCSRCRSGCLPSLGGNAECEWELYDLAKDRTELSNLASTQPDRVQELASLYDEWAARSGVKPWTDPQTPIGGRR